MSEEVEPYFLRLARSVVDGLFLQGYFHDKVGREDMRNLDELLGYLLQSQSESGAKCALLTRRIREKPAEDKT